MKLSVEKRKAIWIKIGLSVVFYGATGVIAEEGSYSAFIPLGIAFILLGYVLPELQYLREKPRRLAISYVILIWLGSFHVRGTIITVGGEYINWGVIELSNFLLSIILSILVYFLILQKVEPVLSEAKQQQEKHLDTKSTFSNKPSISSKPSITNKLSRDNLIKLSTPLKVIFSLFLLSNILAVMAILLKQYVSLAFAIPVAITAAILPFLKYLKEKPGRLSFAYIALLNISYLIILPATAVGFAFHYGIQNLIPILVYIPLALSAISLFLYLTNRVNIDNIVKGILRKMYYERESRINTFNQLNEAEAKSYRNQVYFAVLFLILVLNIAAFAADVIIIVNNYEVLYLSIYSQLAYFVLALFTLKRFLVKLYPLLLQYCLLLSILLVYSNTFGEDRRPHELTFPSVILLYLILVGLVSAVCKIYRNTAESKFVWRDDAVKVGTKK